MRLSHIMLKTHITYLRTFLSCNSKREIVMDKIKMVYLPCSTVIVEKMMHLFFFP